MNDSRRIVLKSAFISLVHVLDSYIGWISKNKEVGRKKLEPWIRYIVLSKRIFVREQRQVNTYRKIGMGWKWLETIEKYQKSLKMKIQSPCTKPVHRWEREWADRSLYNYMSMGETKNHWKKNVKWLIDCPLIPV